MFNIKIISLLASIVFLVIGCKEPVSVKDSSSSISSQSTLNDPNLDGQLLADYFYSFEEEITLDIPRLPMTREFQRVRQV